MKIIIFTGSHRLKSNSSFMATSFIQGSSEKGHKIYRFDAAFKKLHGCIACNKCEMKNPCIFKDDFVEAREKLIEADVVVFATPIYFYGMSAQIKLCIDRFYSTIMHINERKLSILLAVSGQTDKNVMNSLVSQYELIATSLNWKDVGQILADGFLEEGAIAKTIYHKMAYELGKSL